MWIYKSVVYEMRIVCLSFCLLLKPSFLPTLLLHYTYFGVDDFGFIHLSLTTYECTGARILLPDFIAW